MNIKGPWANPDVHPRLRDALKNYENATYTDLVKWRDMYENVTPGQHVTGELCGSLILLKLEDKNYRFW